MTCLTDAEIQTLADGEATATAVAHAAACERCRDRVDARRRDMAAVTALMSSDADVPLEVESRLRRAILAGRPARGATALRAPVPGGWGRAGWLSGVAVAERTNASTTGLLDVHRRTWDDELIARLKLPRSLFADLASPGDVIGPLRAELQVEVGAGPDTLLALVGSHDTASAVVGVPASALRTN